MERCIFCGYWIQAAAKWPTHNGPAHAICVDAGPRPCPIETCGVPAGLPGYMHQGPDCEKGGRLDTDCYA